MGGLSLAIDLALPSRTRGNRHGLYLVLPERDSRDQGHKKRQHSPKG